MKNQAYEQRYEIRQSRLCTGNRGTSGIGYELAKLLCQDGHNLILVARSGERLKEVCNEFRTQGVTAIPLVADLFQPDAAMQVYETIRARQLPVSILINNAGQEKEAPSARCPSNGIWTSYN